MTVETIPAQRRYTCDACGHARTILLAEKGLPGGWTSFAITNCLEETISAGTLCQPCAKELKVFVQRLFERTSS